MDTAATVPPGFPFEPTSRRRTVAPVGAVVEHELVEGVLRWTVRNGGCEAIRVDRAEVRLDRPGGVRPRRALHHGWQSWSACGGASVGEHADPSLEAGAGSYVRAMFHAEPSPAAPGTVRSELVTVVADDDGAVCLGFDGGDRHDGTFRIDGNGVTVEAWLGGAVLAPGERRQLHDVAVFPGDPEGGLDRWARWAGERSGARVDAPFQVGWCSWYQYFHDVTEADVRANLARAGDWPFDVFQLDDGYQAAIGDWLLRAPTFPAPLERLAADVADAGFVPGLWLAPFLASPSSRLAAEHPGWLVERSPGRRLVGMVNDGWGGEQHVLDTTHPDVLAHLEALASTLVAMGWRYLKLDFTYAPSFDGRWHDPAQTPAQRVRAGFDAIRRGAGEDVFVLGCGAPLGPCIGAVDGMRIGPDVAPRWAPAPGRPYLDTAPATRNAWRNTLARSFQHRRLWLNDPDCLLLRTEGTDLDAAQVEAWALAVGASGGMALVSDDLSLLGPPARRLLDEVLAIGRAADAAARPPSCPDLLDRWTPARLSGAVGELTGDPEAGTATFTPSSSAGPGARA